MSDFTGVCTELPENLSKTSQTISDILGATMANNFSLISFHHYSFQ
jgi:hypothetical protein